MAVVNQEYKDRLFTFIFGGEENREWTLSLYNAINGSTRMHLRSCDDQRGYLHRDAQRCVIHRWQ